VVAALQQTSSYWTTSENLAPAVLYSKVQDAIKCGAQRIQLRAHHLSEREYAELARKTLAHARKHKVEVFLNAPIALCADLKSSLHMSSARLMQVNKRPLPDTQRIIASCHNQEELEHAQRIGVDVAVLGPVQSTATHADAKPMGWDKFAELRAMVSLPIYALGGLSMNDLAIARQHGAQGIAGIRGFFM
jgi:8-oxo-dGTP diphosphatase